MLLKLIKGILWLPVFVFSGFKVNLLKRKVKLNKAGLPPQMSLVLFTTNLFVTEKDFIKEYDKIFTRNSEYLVGEIADGVHWAGKRWFSNNPTVDKLSAKEAVAVCLNGINPTFVGVISTHLVPLLSSSRVFVLHETDDYTKKIWSMIETEERKQKIKELQSAKDLPEECYECGATLILDEDMECEVCTASYATDNDTDNSFKEVC